MSQAKTIVESRQMALQHFERILRRATEKKASDLHIKAGLPPIVRVNGQLYYLGEDASDDHIVRLTAKQVTQFAECLLNPRQLERYEQGEEVDLGYEISGIGRFRVNVCQQRSHPRLVCRYIPDSVRSLRDLFLPNSMEELASHRRGLILVTGATGTGKSTTLAALVDYIARTRSCHIITIEDPIEFVFKDRKSIITQREVGLDTRNFAMALKYALRQDPDVILVGEMRDEETMLMALAAAETGHLVLSSLHTLDATETVNRILSSIQAGLQAQARAQLAASLIGVVSQRLIRRKDGKGRIPAVEVLRNNARVREMLSDPQRTPEILRAIEESSSIGMQSFDQSLMLLVQQDLITQEEALNHCSNKQDFLMRLRGVVSGEWLERTQIAGQGSSPEEKRDDGGDGEVIEIDLDDPSKSRP